MNHQSTQLLKVLIVDDNDALRQALSDFITFLHPTCQVFKAENGKRGLEMAQAVQPTLMITDFNLPILNGCDMAVALQRDPRTRTIPLVLASSDYPHNAQFALLHSLCQATLGKPFDLNLLEQILESMVAEQSEQPQYAYAA